MHATVTRTFLGIFVGLVLLASARAQAPYEGTGEQAQQPVQQPTEEKPLPSKGKEFTKVFCAERSVAQRYMMVNAIDCNDMCDNVYQEYPCELQQRLSEGWKITSVSVATRTLQRDPCECGLTGTESVLERTK